MLQTLTQRSRVKRIVSDSSGGHVCVLFQDASAELHALLPPAGPRQWLVPNVESAAFLHPADESDVLLATLSGGFDPFFESAGAEDSAERRKLFAMGQQVLKTGRSENGLHEVPGRSDT